MKKQVSIIILGIGLISILAVHVSSAATSNPQGWISAKTPEFKVKKATVADTDYPTTVSGNGNISCDTLTFTKRDGGLFSPVPKLYKESKVTGCYVNSLLGAWDSNGYVNVPGTEYVAQTVNSQSQPVGFSAYQNTDLFISNVSSAPVGLYAWFDHLATSLTFTTAVDGKIFARIQPQNPRLLTDKAGNSLPLMTNNMSLSDNGDWLIVDSPARGLLRINTQTMEVLPFTTSFEFGNGIGATIRTAVSGDGRYVAVASKNYQTFKVFDLSTCEATPNVITRPVACSSRDLLPFFTSKVPGFSSILQMRFSSNNLLNLYASYSAKIGFFAVAAPDTSLSGMDYLALGDSFSSGEGAQKYEIGTDYNPENLCHLSKVSYPYLINRALGFSSFHSVACSGAQRYKLIGGKGLSKEEPTPSHENQYYRDTPINSLGVWQPGYIRQVKFVEVNDPRIITLTLSGNDIAFSDKLIRCLKPGTCYPTYEDKKEVFSEIERIFSPITSAYKTIKKTAPENAKIYIIGYPQIALASGNCAVNVHLNKDELEFAESVITQLNATIKSAAEKAGVVYVDITDALYGYRLCENDTGNIAMNGLTAGNDILHIIGNESYHPNEFGHELMANKILGVTNNLTAALPNADATKTAPKVSEDNETLKKSPKTNRKQNKTTPTPIAPKKSKKGGKINIKLQGSTNGTAPNTTYQINVGGTTTTTTSNSAGNIDTEVTIPADTPTGPTDIHVIGEDVTGETVDYNDNTYVDGNENDVDDDGIANTTDSCPQVPNSNIDQDQDSIDDVCDNLIGPAPVASNEPPSNESVVEDPTSYAPSSISNVGTSQSTTYTQELLLVENAVQPSNELEVIDNSTGPLEIPRTFQTGNISFSFPKDKFIDKSVPYQNLSFYHNVKLDLNIKPFIAASQKEALFVLKNKPFVTIAITVFLVLALMYEVLRFQPKTKLNAYGLSRTS